MEEGKKGEKEEGINQTREEKENGRWKRRGKSESKGRKMLKGREGTEGEMLHG